MKLVCSQSELNTGLALVGRAVAARPSHPVLANVLLTATDDDRLSLAGYDLSLGIQTSLPAAVETPGAITIPARLLQDIISKLPSDGPITIAGDDQQVEITSTTGSYQVRGLPAADFPDLPDPAGDPVQLPTGALVAGIRATLFASSSDEAKQLLTGVHLQASGNGLEFAATDGHRLAVLTAAGPAEEALDLTIPSKALRELERLLPDEGMVDLLSVAGQVVVRWGHQVFTSRSLEGTYPAYRKLLPAQFNHRISLDRRVFAAALERVAVLADQHNSVVKVTVDPDRGLAVITTEAQDVGSGSECVAVGVERRVPYGWPGADLQIAFNVRYLLDGIKAMRSDRVVLQANAPTTPVVLHPDEDEPAFTYLVMPVQVRS